MAIDITVRIKVSERNKDIISIMNRIKCENQGFYSDEVCQLIREGYRLREMSAVPRLDIFHRMKIKGKCVADALYDGDISEQEILDMFLSCKSFIEEMYSSRTLQRIVDRQKNGDISLKKGGLDWLQRF